MQNVEHVIPDKVNVGAIHGVNFLDLMLRASYADPPAPLFREIEKEPQIATIWDDRKFTTK
jgi:hypothetical protein